MLHRNGDDDDDNNIIEDEEEAENGEMTEDILKDDSTDELFVRSNQHSKSAEPSVSGCQPEIRYVLG